MAEEVPEWLKELTEEPKEDYFPGTDPDGKERLDPFALHYAAPNSAMSASVQRPPEDFEPKPKPGAVQRSPFV